MKKNMGTIDRGARTLAALTIVVLLLTGVISGTIGTILGIFAVVFLATSAIAFCPLYTLFKVSTRKEP